MASLRHLLNIQNTKSIKANKNYISATEFENFINGDLVCDWLNIVLPKIQENHPLQQLFNKGIHYEAEVIDVLRKKFKLPLEKLSSLSTSREYTQYEHKLDLKTTITAMKRGDHILYSAFIAGEKEEIRGIPDLLVRSDYIEKYFGVEVPQEESLFGSYYYIPIEIKYSSLHFDKSEKTLLNINRTKMYKTQLCVYSKILSELQSVFPCCAFILCKNFIKDLKQDQIKLGHVYFQTRDNEIVSLFYKGIEWLRDVNKNAHKWDEFSVKLLPNMKVNNPLYETEKKILSEHFGEITEFWQCSLKHRYNLLENTNDKIYSWKDPEFDTDLLGVPKAYFDKVDKLIKINRGELGCSVYPKKIKHDLYEWRSESDEMFVDFETVGDINENEESTIYLIGVYYRRKYTYFLADNIGSSAEKEIVLSFYNFWKDNGKPRAWYWYAENSFWDRVCKKYELQLQINWNDLHKVFFEGNVLVKGCKNFKLKSYINSLVKLGKINIKLPPENCCNGLDALFLGATFYENRDQAILQSILLYNEFDCKSLHTLLQFIRSSL